MSVRGIGRDDWSPHLELLGRARPPLVLSAELAEALARERTDTRVLACRSQPIRRPLTLARAERDVRGLACVVEVEEGGARALDVGCVLLCPCFFTVDANEQVWLAVR